MIPLFFALWFQSLDLPHAGWVRSGDGRLWEVAGVAGNFVLRDPLPADATSTAKANGIITEIKSKSALIRQQSFSALILSRDRKGDTCASVHCRLRCITEGADPCPNPGWQTPAPITRIEPQSTGWMFLYTGAAVYAARCDSTRVFLLPEPPE